MKNDQTAYTAEQIASSLGIALSQLRELLADEEDPIPSFTPGDGWGQHPSGGWDPTGVDVVAVLGDTPETPAHARRPVDLADLRFRGEEVMAWLRRREADAATGEPSGRRRVLDADPDREGDVAPDERAA
jgi:hypothetical protein